MSKKRRSHRHRLSAQALQMSITAPQVAAARLAKMAFAGPFHSQADCQEMSLMVNEKLQAFWQSWSAMWFSVAALPWTFSGSSGLVGPRAIEQVLQAGLAPVHATVMSNSRRLARKRRIAAIHKA